MASNAKKKTTFAKLNRENALRERRQRKQEKKEARRQAGPASPPESGLPGEDAAPGPVDPPAAAQDPSA